MKALILAFTMLFVLAFPANAALPSFPATQVAAEETAKCPDGSFEDTGKYAKENGFDYIIVEEPALSTLAQVILDIGGQTKPAEVVKVVLIIPPADGMVFPMASFDENGCFLFGGSITPDTFTIFTQELGKQKEAGQ